MVWAALTLLLSVVECRRFNKRCDTCMRLLLITWSIYGVCDCDDTIEEPYSAWSEWSACSGDCMKPVRYRTRIDPNETVSITTDGCEQQLKERCCGFEQWTEWSTCNETCGAGFRARDRNWTQTNDPILKIFCSAKTSEVKPCYEKLCYNDCIVRIGSWSDCSATCGKMGTRKRDVKILIKPSKDGKPCPEIAKTEACPGDPCPLHCLWDDWVAEECDQTCGNGTQLQTRKKTRQNHFNGTCDIDRRNVTCALPPCATNCTLGEFEEWSACSVTCGRGGRQSRKRIVLKKQSKWGWCQNDFHKACNNSPACPPLYNYTDDASDETEPSNSNVTALAAIGAVAGVVVLALLVATVYYVFHKGAKKQPSRKEVYRAITDILGENVVAKERTENEKDSPKKKLKKSHGKLATKKSKESIAKKSTESSSEEELTPKMENGKGAKESPGKNAGKKQKKNLANVKTVDDKTSPKQGGKTPCTNSPTSAFESPSGRDEPNVTSPKVSLRPPEPQQRQPPVDAPPTKGDAKEDPHYYFPVFKK